MSNSIIIAKTESSAVENIQFFIRNIGLYGLTKRESFKRLLAIKQSHSSSLYPTIRFIDGETERIIVQLSAEQNEIIL